MLRMWLSKYKMLKKNEVCKSCVLGKYHKQVFPKGVSWNEKEAFDHIHPDVSWREKEAFETIIWYSLRGKILKC